MKNETKGMLLGLLGVIGFGLTLPMTKFALPYMDPIFIAFGRAVLAASVAAFLLVWFREKRPNVKQFQKLAVVALGVVIGFPVLSTWSMQYVPASHGGVVLGILPLSTAIVGVIISHERPSIGFWLVGIVGCGLVVSYTLLQGSGSMHIADLVLLGAVIAAAIGYAVGAQLAKEMGGWQVICWALILTFPFVLLPSIITAPENWSAIPFSGFSSFFYLALVSQLFAFFAWYKAMAIGGIARVSQAQLLQPFITLLASVALLNEPIDVETGVFIFLVVCSVWLGKRMPISQKPITLKIQP